MTQHPAAAQYTEPHPLSRRSFLKFAAFIAPSLLGVSATVFGAVGCQRHRYIRPEGALDLGTVRELLYTVVHVRNKAALVYRDDEGWQALSIRCTYDGCDCTYQEPILFCPCCKSQFDLKGGVLSGSHAKDNMPWMEINYKEGHPVS